MIEFDETIRAACYFHFCDKGDFLAVVNEKPEGFFVTGRMRWYREDTGDAFADKDEKQWFSSRSGEPDLETCMAQIQASCDKMKALSELAGQGGDPEPWVAIRGTRTRDEFFEEFKRQKFVHMKQVSV